jgi:HAD superfamily hydrolase (TIGR01509 family)
MYTAEESINHLFRDDPQCAQAQQFRFQIDYEQFIRLMVMEPHLVKVLDTLRDRYRLAVATNRTDTIHTILDTFALTGYFDLVVSSLDVERPKPHPEAALKILEHFSVTPRESIYVGDSVVDNEVATQAGVLFVAYQNRELNADYHIDALEELPPIVTGANG